MRNQLLRMSAVGVIASAGGWASAQTYTIADGNSTAHIDPTQTAPLSRVGMDRWEIDGINHLYSQWFWFRTDGMNSEARLNTLPLITGGTSDTNFNNIDDTLFLSYGTRNDYTIDTTFVLRGGNQGSGTADIGEQIRITNFGSTPRTFSFFQYCDFDLNNDIVDDLVGVINANAVRQADFLNGLTVAETIITPTFTFSEVGVYSATLAKLDNQTVDNLDGSTGPLTGRRDYTWAFQWDFTLDPGRSFLISKDKQIVPPPGTVALLGIAGLASIRRRR